MFYDVSENYWAAGEKTPLISQVIRLADAVSDGNANKEKVLKQQRQVCTDSNKHQFGGSWDQR
jgi:hypothetical protein